MKINATCTNEFTGEIFSDRSLCEQAERESRKEFIKNLIGDIKLIKNICNSHKYCKNCPFSDSSGDCVADVFIDNYFNIVHCLQRIND